MNTKFSKPELENRTRLEKIIANIPEGKELDGFLPPMEIAIGGLMAIGLSEDSRHLLAVSSTGRGIFEVTTGSRIDRDRDESFAWFDFQHLRCQGFGVLAGTTVPMAGLYGGGLPTTTKAGESLEKIAPLWPKESIIYSSGFNSLHISPEDCTLIFEDHEIRAYGFSPDQRSILLASPDTLVIVNRK